MNRLSKLYRGKIITLIIILLVSSSFWQFSTAGWIQGKAFVAQLLLNHSWNQTLKNSASDDSNNTHKPWPWADTWPVAKLIVPQYDIEQIVLAGDSGNSLAFGPGHSFASAMPNTAGLTMISAHRDTHFRFLKEIKINDTIYVQSRTKRLAYQVNHLQIVDIKHFTQNVDWHDQTILLATCYPFDALEAGGSLRYLVYAKRKNIKKNDKLTHL